METIVKVMWRVLGYFLQQSARKMFDFAIKIVDLEGETIAQQEGHYIMSLEYPTSLLSSAHF